MKIAAGLAAILLLAGCAGGAGKPEAARSDAVSGAAVARDGDTVEVGGTLMDLWGVEAPNLSNADGWYARAALDDLIGADGTLTCTVKVRTSRRTYAVCASNRVGDVGRALIQGGWAVVSRSDRRDRKIDSVLGDAYERAEKRARESRVGLWSQMPNR